MISIRTFYTVSFIDQNIPTSGVFRRGLVGVNPPHDLTDEQAYTAICNLFIS